MDKFREFKNLLSGKRRSSFENTNEARHSSSRRRSSTERERERERKKERKKERKNGKEISGARTFSRMEIICDLFSEKTKKDTHKILLFFLIKMIIKMKTQVIKLIKMKLKHK